MRGWSTGATLVATGRRSTPAGERDVLEVREQLRRGVEPFEMLPVALTPSPGPPTRPLETATAAAARHALDTWRATGSLPLDAASDLLARRPPRLVDDGALPPPEDDLVAPITAAVERLDRSYLAVQGPPGTGKTHVGSHVVARLVARGWRVGVVAQSHAVVENMLRAIVEKAGVPAEIVAKKRAGDGPSSTAVCAELDGAALAAFASEAGPRVVGGTAWDFAAERLGAQTLDLLVVDEAGQLSLATTVAVSRAAHRLLLLGDPQQLPQVSQGRHPEPVDRSALGWLADGHGVLPSDRGYFLPTTWRMHPRLAQAVSTLAYEDRLHAHPCTAARDLDGVPPGIEQVLVEHAGNSVRSPEEAAEVVRQVERVLGRTWTTTVDGVEERRPLGQGDVLVVAAKKERISERTTVIEHSGRTPAVIDVEAFALANAYQLNYPERVDALTALVHVGKSGTIVCLLERSDPVFSRHIPLGGQAHVEALMREGEIEEKAAREMLHGKISKRLNEKKITGVLRDASAHLASEIRKSIDFYRESDRTAALGRVAVSGGAWQAAGLFELLKTELGAPVDVFDPFRHVSNAGAVGKESTGPAYAVAVGLAMRQDGA